ncbi:MAG: hypothetical protein ACE5RH_03650 [Nitrosarchaeum sp.]
MPALQFPNLSQIYLQISYLNPFDDPADIVSSEDIIAGSVDIAIAGLSIFLTILSLRAYKKTKLPQLKYIGIAFSLFSVYLGIDALQELLPINEDSFDFILSLIVLFILICFFLGIMKKSKNNLEKK